MQTSEWLERPKQFESAIEPACVLFEPEKFAIPFDPSGQFRQ
jgi:hypothetical protein